MQNVNRHHRPIPIPAKPKIKMSARLTNRLLKAVVSAEQQVQEQQLGGGKNKRKSNKNDASKLKKKREKKKAADGGTQVDPTTAHLNAILQFDQAVERYSSNGEKSLKRKTKENEAVTKRRKKARQADSAGGGSARSCSGPSLKLEPTFNKKREAKRSEAKRLADLARALKRGVKKK